jgi:chondroitin 4-sulfotransferase 11
VIVSQRAQCIFVHIQKTGGSSIEKLLRAHDSAIGSHLHNGRRHLSALEMEAIIAPDIWNSYFKFAFVRNPWDRLVSWYHMCTQAVHHNNFSRYIKDNAPTFADFLTRTTTGIAAKTTWNQLDYVTDERGQVMIDFIGRYETLHEDLSVVTRRLALPFDVPHENKSRHRNYREYYTDETAGIVARRFEKDIRHFGYEF